LTEVFFADLFGDAFFFGFFAGINASVTLRSVKEDRLAQRFPVSHPRSFSIGNRTPMKNGPTGLHRTVGEIGLALVGGNV
jgi:hypothetical protein